MRIYPIEPGDVVKIKRVPKESFKEHGGWVTSIRNTFGKTGIVASMMNPTTFRVIIDGTDVSWHYPITALKLIAEHQ